MAIYPDDEIFLAFVKTRRDANGISKRKENKNFDVLAYEVISPIGKNKGEVIGYSMWAIDPNFEKGDEK